MKDKKKLVTYLGAIGLFLLVIGISYAAFTANYVGDKEQQIVIGEDFIFSYNETSNALSLTDEDILSDTNGKASTKYFDFNVKLKTQYEQNVDYYIYLTKDASSTLDDKYIKLYLTDQDDTLVKDVTTIKKLIPHETYASSYYLYDKNISSNNNTETTHNYRLRVWVSDTYDTTYQTSEPGDGTHTSTTTQKTYKFTVNVATGEVPVVEGNLIKTWKDKTENEASYLALYTLNKASLPATYDYDGKTYTLETTIDVSAQTNTAVKLGEYTNGDEMIAVINQYGGVVAPTGSVSELFSYLTNVKLIDASNLDTRNATNMNGMFHNNTNLVSIDVSGFDTSNVTDMWDMFNGCINLTSLDLSDFVTTSLTDMSRMFQDCTKLASVNLNNFDTSEVTNMSRLFWGCEALTTLDLSNFNTSKVTNMFQMFADCTLLTEVKVGCDWTVGSSTDTLNMFTDAGVSEVTKVC